MIDKQQMDEIRALIAALDERVCGMITTVEQRHKVEELRVQVIDRLRRALPEIDALINARSVPDQRLIHERDALATRADHLDASVKLWQRTNRWLPTSGVVCDHEDCEAAIGLVGAKIDDGALDEVASLLLDIAHTIGWHVEADGHRCPRHKDLDAKGFV